MSEPILVQPISPSGWMPSWTVDSLIEDLENEGLDARLSHEEFGGGGAAWEAVAIWVADAAGTAVISLVVNYAAKWIQDQFRKHPDVLRPRVAEIFLYEDDKGKLYMRIEQKAADEQPVYRTSSDFGDFERWTRRKPAEGIYPLVQAGDWVRVRAVPALEASQRYAGQLGKVISPPTMSPGGDYTILMSDGTETLLRREAFTLTETDENGVPL